MIDHLSILELERMDEILATIATVIENDDMGITWDLESLVQEAQEMVRRVRRGEEI